MARRRKTRAKRIRSAIVSFRSILDTALLLVILGLLIDRRRHSGDGRSLFEVAGDVTGFAPRFSQQITTFKPDPSFVPHNMSQMFSESVQEKWLSIVPKGLGYIHINNTKAYDNLPTPLKTYPDYTFTTSMTHQLHCLHAIAETFAAMSSNRPDKMPSEGPWHLAHCFDYLRQSIMCCGDVALEGEQTTFPPDMRGSDGWDAKHVCKDYGQVLAHLEANRADDEMWI
ncbi:hypothetical protein QBC39DRAFT_247100 [Podospora conica]|nr:hypothetical protein QBC39DRAFT_247100 [Schizothecium conicum]